MFVIACFFLFFVGVSDYSVRDVPLRQYSSSKFPSFAQNISYFTPPPPQDGGKEALGAVPLQSITAIEVDKSSAKLPHAIMVGGGGDKDDLAAKVWLTSLLFEIWNNFKPAKLSSSHSVTCHFTTVSQRRKLEYLCAITRRIKEKLQ